MGSSFGKFMKGIKIEGGYVIDFSTKDNKQVFQYMHRDQYGNVIRNFRGEFDAKLKEDLEFSDFLIKSKKKIKGEEVEWGNLQPIKEIFRTEELDMKKHFEYAKAIIAKQGTGGSYLANTVNNLYVFKNDVLISGGIIDSQDLIALSVSENNEFETYKDSLNAQKKLKGLVDFLRIRESNSNYFNGFFIGLPEGLEFKI